MDKTISRAWVTAALENMGQDEDGLYEGYSGRGMYGAECFGFRLDNTSQVAMLAVEISRQAVFAALDRSNDVGPLDSGFDAEGRAETGLDIVTNLFDAAREDSLGRGAIVYFPGWTLAED